MSHTAHNYLSHRQKGVKQDLDDERPDGSGEYRCPECWRQVTVGPSGIEYGHNRGQHGSAGRRRYQWALDRALREVDDAE